MIYATETLAYYFGMKPNEFWNGRFLEIKIYCEVNLARVMDNLKQEINLQEAVTNKLIMGDCMNQRAKIVLIRSNYPELFKEKDEEKQTLEEQRRILKG